jgi:phosphomannomutase
VRYSGTEPKIRLLVEARDTALVDTWLAHLTDAVKAELA